MVDGTSIGTTTNAGRRSTRLSAPRLTAPCSVTFIGYVGQQRTAIAGKSRIERDVMHEDTQAIDDVIVVAFGTSKKEAFTGSATVIKADDIAKSPDSRTSPSRWPVRLPVSRLFRQRTVG